MILRAIHVVGAGFSTDFLLVAPANQHYTIAPSNTA
jgi:hypothetical protein